MQRKRGSDTGVPCAGLDKLGTAAGNDGAKHLVVTGLKRRRAGHVVRVVLQSFVPPPATSHNSPRRRPLPGSREGSGTIKSVRNRGLLDRCVVVRSFTYLR
jgi:hypothetical protein